MANHRGGSGNFAEDRERASEAGKKVDSTARVISRMTRSAHLKQVKKVVRAVTAKATTSRANQ